MKNRKIAIVTGASRIKAIGAAICLELAKAGMDIFFTYYRPYDAEQHYESENQETEILESLIRETGVRSANIELDLSKTESIPVLFDQVEKTLGEPSILINNAAYSTENDFETITAENLDLHYFVNVRAPLMLSAEFAKRFQHGKGGRIIYMTSGQSLGPMPGELAYAATKACIPDMTKTLAAEVGSKGITVNAVNPGPTDTGWMTADLKTVLIEKFPMNRIGQPKDAARLVAFLSSDAGEWITGQTIHSEGGFLRT
jgi:3-oxoacyl-[acyl-carrier protein] reductase